MVAVLPSDDDEEVVALANNSEYGLAATVWTKDIARAHRLAKRIQSGTVTLNCQMVFDHLDALRRVQTVRLGLRRMGPVGIESYLQTKTVYAQL